MLPLYCRVTARLDIDADYPRSFSIHHRGMIMMQQGCCKADVTEERGATVTVRINSVVRLRRVHESRHSRSLWDLDCRGSSMQGDICHDCDYNV